jgi:hypothetical protein
MMACTDTVVMQDPVIGSIDSRLNMGKLALLVHKTGNMARWVEGAWGRVHAEFNGMYYELDFASDTKYLPKEIAKLPKNNELYINAIHKNSFSFIDNSHVYLLTRDRQPTKIGKVSRQKWKDART